MYTLITTSAAGLEIASLVSVAGPRARVMAAAKKAAGKGAVFFRAGTDCGYRGAVGTAWLS